MTLRAFAIGIGVVVLCLVAAALVAVQFVDWNEHRDKLADAMESKTGFAVSFDGPVDVSIFPRPRISAAGVRLNHPELTDTIDIGRIDAAMGIAALIGGDLVLDDVIITEAVWTTDLGASRTPFAALGTGQGGKLSIGDAIFTDSRIVLRAGTWSDEILIKSLQLEPVVSRTGLQVSGAISLNGHSATIDGRAGVLSGPENNQHRSVRLSADFAELDTLVALDGLVRASGPQAGFTGQMVATASRLGTLLKRPDLNGPASIEARLQPDGLVIGLKDLNIELEGEKFSGTGEVLTGENLSVNTALVIRQADGDRLEKFWPGPFKTSPLPKGLTVSIAIKIGRLRSRGGILRDVKLIVSGRGDDLEIRQVEATLPGNSRIEAKGHAFLGKDDTRFDGQVSASSDSLRDVMRWLDLDFPTDNLGTFRAFSFQSRVVAKSSEIAFTDVVASLDSVPFSGGIRFARGARSRLTIAGDLGKLNADLYELSAPVEAAARLSASMDLELIGNIRSVVLNSAPVDDVTLSAFLSEGSIKLDTLKIGQMRGVKIEASGYLDGETATLSGRLSTKNLWSALPEDARASLKRLPTIRAADLGWAVSRSAGNATVLLEGTADAFQINRASAIFKAGVDWPPQILTLNLGNVDAGLAANFVADLTVAGEALDMVSQGEPLNLVIGLEGTPLKPRSLTATAQTRRIALSTGSNNQDRIIIDGISVSDGTGSCDLEIEGEGTIAKITRLDPFHISCGDSLIDGTMTFENTHLDGAVYRAAIRLPLAGVFGSGSVVSLSDFMDQMTSHFRSGNVSLGEVEYQGAASAKIATGKLEFDAGGITASDLEAELNGASITGNMRVRTLQRGVNLTADLKFQTEPGSDLLQIGGFGIVGSAAGSLSGSADYLFGRLDPRSVDGSLSIGSAAARIVPAKCVSILIGEEVGPGGGPFSLEARMRAGTAQANVVASGRDGLIADAIVSIELDGLESQGVITRTGPTGRRKVIPLSGRLCQP